MREGELKSFFIVLVIALIAFVPACIVNENWKIEAIKHGVGGYTHDRANGSYSFKLKNCVEE